jgi:hypothetical protein
MTADERASARLLFAHELAAGHVDQAALDRVEVARAVRPTRVPPVGRRLRQRLAMKRGHLTYEAACVAPFMAARRAVLGDGAEGAPRLLVRVDEFPHFRAADGSARYASERFARFHAIMASARVPYLLAVLPRLAHRPLRPRARGSRAWHDDERAVLTTLAGEGVALGLHGLDHRTRRTLPQQRSELAGLSATQLTERVSRAERELARLGVHPRVFIAPYNRFDAAHYGVLAERYDVVCGGPESVGCVGFQRTPLWRGPAVYMPSYPPLYGGAAAVQAGVERLVAARAAIWAPVVLHWGHEAKAGWAALERLADLLASYARPWDEFLTAVESSR